MSKTKDVKKVVLAYSGGLDTSIILKWLQTELGAEVVTFTADLGQGGELEPARKKAEMMGIKDIRIVDVREEFVADFVFPMFRANAVYEGIYLLGTSIARPLISKHLVEIAKETGADAIAHGATGKGNDQVRFELSAYALNPDIKVIAPWRDWSFKSRTDLIDFAEQHQIPVPKDKRGDAPFSVDANLLHSSSEGKVLEDPWSRAAGIRPSAHRLADGRAGQGHRDRDRVHEGRSDRAQRQEAVAGDDAGRAQRSRPRQRHRPARPGREPLRRHEVARRLRNARRHDPDRRPTAPSNRSRSTGVRRTSRTSSCRAMPS